MTLLIGFTGLKGSGKDTAGEVFRQRGFKRISFAEPLKAMLTVLLERRGCPSPYEFTDGLLKEDPTEYLMGVSPRRAMQTLGTEWGRQLIGADLWIDTFKRRSAKMMKEGQAIVVTDVRFPNEVEAIQDLGGQVFRVVRPGTVETGHPSESEVKGLCVNGEILNDATSAKHFQFLVYSRFEHCFPNGGG
jgi:hypothetical protein